MHGPEALWGTTFITPIAVNLFKYDEIHLKGIIQGFRVLCVNTA